MSPKSECLVLILVVSFYVACNAAPPALDTWKPIKPKNRNVIELGRFAVEKYNRLKHKDLAFQRVLHGQSKVAPGGILHIWMIIAAKDGTAENRYRAEMEEFVAANQKILTNFRKI